MKASATVPPAVAALNVIVYIKNTPIRAIVTREAVEARFGCIGKTQSDLLAAYQAHASDIEALVLGEFHRTRKQPLIFLGPRDEPAPQAAPCRQAA